MGAVFGFKGLRPDRNAKIHVDQAGPRYLTASGTNAIYHSAAQINIFSVNLLQGLFLNKDFAPRTRKTVFFTTGVDSFCPWLE